ncbi:MAG TPA: hypothetical protein PKH92_09600 [Anaerolineaceae bacterium]|jgi:hypothetical protein|nr:hypothetical protein [Anaerolineaceae bacterium]
MNVGMLWFDNDPKVDLAAKISAATAYYKAKYGQQPNLCFVHPSMLPENAPPPHGMEVRSNRMILPNHLWIGIQEAA